LTKIEVWCRNCLCQIYKFWKSIYFVPTYRTTNIMSHCLSPKEQWRLLLSDTIPFVGFVRFESMDTALNIVLKWIESHMVSYVMGLEIHPLKWYPPLPWGSFVFVWIRIHTVKSCLVWILGPWLNLKLQNIYIVYYSQKYYFQRYFYNWSPSMHLV